MVLGAILGIGTSIFGASQQSSAARRAEREQRKQVEAQYEYNKKTWDFGKDRLKADRKFAIEGIEIAKRNEKTLADLKDNAALDNYEYSLKIRQQQMRQNVKQFDKSYGLYNSQNEFNSLAQKLANADSKIKYAEIARLAAQQSAEDNRLNRQLFDEESRLSALRYGEGKRIADEELAEGLRISNQQLSEGTRVSTNKFENAYRQAQMTFNEQLRGAAVANQDSIIEALQRQGAVEAKGVSGNSASRLAGNVISALGRNQAAIQSKILSGGRIMNESIIGAGDAYTNEMRALQLTNANTNRTLELNNMNASRALGLTAANEQRALGFNLANFMRADGIKNSNTAMGIALNSESEQRSIALQKLGADIQAFSNLMIPAEEPLMPPDPRQTPLSEYQMPRELEDFDFGPEPIKGAMPTYNASAPWINALNSGVQTIASMFNNQAPQANYSSNIGGFSGGFGSGSSGFNLNQNFGFDTSVGMSPPISFGDAMNINAGGFFN